MKKNKFSKFAAIVVSAFIITVVGVFSANAAVENTPVSVGSETDVSGIPSEYSSATLGYVTPIKNQGSNDCWAYAGISAFESKLLREGNNIGSMSAQWANVWATKRLNGAGWQRDFYTEGYSEIMPGYLTSWYGGIQESDISAVDLDSGIYGDLAPSSLTKYGTTSLRYLSNSNNDQIKRSIMDNGGVCTSYAQTVSCMKNNISYFMPESYTGSYIGHSVEVVGWDDNYSKNNFGGYEDILPDNDGAWLVRNSWGNYNSLGGYFWISYEDKYIFSSYYGKSYTIEDVMEITDDVMLKQNEIYGATYEFSYVISDEITYINRFDFSDEYNVLDKVIFETQCVGADYDIFYIPVVNEVPDNDKNNWIKLDSGKVEFSGYICADFDDFIVPDNDGAVAVRIDTSKLNEGKRYDVDPSYVFNSIGVGEWMRTSAEVYTFLNDSNYGDSFIKYGNNMMELLDWYKYALDDDMGGTFVIKAITRTDSEGHYLLGDVNLDGSVTIDDATLAQKYIANSVELSLSAQKNADADKNLKIDIDDVTAIQKYMAGLYEW